MHIEESTTPWMHFFTITTSLVGIATVIGIGIALYFLFTSIQKKKK